MKSAKGNLKKEMFLVLFLLQYKTSDFLEIYKLSKYIKIIPHISYRPSYKWLIIGNCFIKDKNKYILKIILIIQNLNYEYIFLNFKKNLLTEVYEVNSNCGGIMPLGKLHKLTDMCKWNTGTN